MSEGRVEAKRRGGARNIRVDDEMVAEIWRLARENPFTTLVQIQDQLQVNLPQPNPGFISINYMYRSPSNKPADFL